MIPPQAQQHEMRLRDKWNLAHSPNLTFTLPSLHSNWSILRLRGVRVRIIGLITGLYFGTESAVKCGGGCSVSSLFLQG